MRSSAVVLLLATLISPAFAKPAKPPSAPSFTLPARTGTVALDSLRGKAVLVDFWASWCGPCRRSFPWMNEMNHRYGAKGLMIVAINLDKERDKASAFLDEVPAEFTVAFDPSGNTAERYGVKAMPTTFLVSTDGHILATHPGFDPKHTSELETAIAQALPR